MFFDNFKNFYDKYEKIIKVSDIDEKDLKSFWVRYCCGLRELESNNERIFYKDEVNNIIYNSYLDGNTIIVKPTELTNNNDINDIFVLNINYKLNALKYIDGNIIIEKKFRDCYRNAMNIQIKIYDRDATNYLLKDNINDFSNINEFENLILSKQLLPDKKIEVYNFDNNHKTRVKIYKKGEMFKTETLENGLFSSSIFQTVLAFDELLSDLNKDKVKKL